MLLLSAALEQQPNWLPLPPPSAAVLGHHLFTFFLTKHFFPFCVFLFIFSSLLYSLCFFRPPAVLVAADDAFFSFETCLLRCNQVASIDQLLPNAQPAELPDLFDKRNGYFSLPLHPTNHHSTYHH